MVVFLDCPCNSNCPNGCDGCSSPICACGENPTAQNKDNLDNCIRGNSLELGHCYQYCNGNDQCGTSCWEVFKAEYESCPCQVSLTMILFDDLIIPISRLIVTLAAHAMYINVNQIKSLCWCLIQDHLINQFWSSTTVSFVFSFREFIDKFLNKIIEGGEDPNLEFTMGPDTSAYNSCSATINDEFYVFGGTGTLKRQVFWSLYSNP